MQAFIEVTQIFGNKRISIDLNKPLDISIPMRSGSQNPNAFGIPNPDFKPFEAGGFVGSVALGGSVNCENLLLNAHGNGTHTECVGHISKQKITINQSLQHFFAVAQLITVAPPENYITLQSVEGLLHPNIEALIIRTSPNDDAKLTQQYSGENPIALEPILCAKLAELNIKHLLIDLPSVDPEEDGGVLSAHHAFWNYPSNPRLDATITEMVFVPNSIADGMYILNIQIAPLETDASPSKPILYAIH
jgi:kynurenine formamidase